MIYAGYGSSPLDMLSLFVQIRREVITFKPNLIHSQYATLTGAVTILANDKTPTIVSFGGDEIYGTYVSENSNRSARTLLARQFSKYCAQKATVSVVKNDAMRQIVRGWGAKWIEDIPNGVNLTLFRELDQQECRRQLGLRSDGKYIIFIVRDNDYVKRRDLAQKAIELYNSHYPRHLELLALDHIPPNLMPIYLNAGDVLLLCSNHEGSPNIIKEALACNRPVVSTDVGDIFQRFQSVKGLLLVRQTAEDLAHGLEVAINIGRSNGRTFIFNISEEAIALRLKTLYEQVIYGCKALE